MLHDNKNKIPVHSHLSHSTKTYQRIWGPHALHSSKFFAVLGNKANLLSFLCNKWCEKEKLKSALDQTHLYLGGGFKEETRNVGSIEDVPALESTQQEADTRIILHTQPCTLQYPEWQYWQSYLCQWLRHHQQPTSEAFQSCGWDWEQSKMYSFMSIK